jgi:23S rRNA pseudouridine1911/1915/1917 synthase
VRAVSENTQGSKIASLNVKPIQTLTIDGTLTTLVEFELETGRSHQIRVQSAAKNHALIGDPKYGTSRGKTLFHRPALHSCSLEFIHPISKEIMKFESLVPRDWSPII